MVTAILAIGLAPPPSGKSCLRAKSLSRWEKSARTAQAVAHVTKNQAGSSVLIAEPQPQNNN